MAEGSQLGKVNFLETAKKAGLNTEDSHVEELYAYVQKLLPSFSVIEQFDLNDIEPIMTLILSKE